MNPKLRKWMRWLKVIEEDVSELVVAKHIFHTLQGMIRENQSLHQPSSFYYYLKNTYISHTVVGIRRQIKSSDQSISLMRLLEEMKATPEYLSRDHFVSLYKGTRAERYAHGDFDKFARSGAPYIDSDRVAFDLQELLDASSKVEDFADRRVAHRDRREPKQLPTYNEIDDCICVLDKLYAKYYLLFHAQGLTTLSPTWQYDWTAIFRVPWIQHEPL